MVAFILFSTPSIQHDMYVAKAKNVRAYNIKPLNSSGVSREVTFADRLLHSLQIVFILFSIPRSKAQVH
jgi:hypothetical protein